MPPLSIPKWGPVGVRLSLKVESRPSPLRLLAPECLKPPATDIWGTHEPPEPSLQARESLLSTGENQRVQKTSRHPWASPAACSWHEPRHPPSPSLPDSWADCQVRDSHPGWQQTAPTGLGCMHVCCFLAPLLDWVVLLWAANSFLDPSLLPPPSPTSILGKQTGMCLGFAVKSDRSLPTCSGPLRFGVN